MTGSIHTCWRVPLLLVKFLLIWSIILFIPVHGLADDYYVDVNGDNANDGLSPSTPWKTITFAVKQLAWKGPGQVIHIAPGNYDRAHGENYPLTFIPLYGTNGISLKGSGRDTTILDASGIDSRVLFFNQCADIFVKGITITGGVVHPGGGAMRLTSSQRVIISDNLFTNNEADGGGAMYMQGPDLADVTIENNIFRENISTEPGTDGGSIFLYNTGDTPVIRNNLFIHNTSAGGAAGVYCLSAGAPTNAIVENNVFLYNAARWGTAIYAFYSNPAIRNNYIAYNISYAAPGFTEASGGGMLFLNSESLVTGNIIEYNHCDVMGGAMSLAHESNPTFTHNIFRGNTAGSMGGAVFLINSTATFKNNLFINNTADLNNSYSGDAGGGAMYLVKCTAPIELLNNTIIRNHASGKKNISGFQTRGAALYLNEVYVTITNNIIGYNEPGPAVSDHEGFAIPNTILFTSNNFFGNTDGNFYDAETNTVYDLIGDLESHNPGSLNNIDQDPLFATGPYGGSYLSHIAAGNPADSPLIDAGSGNAVDLDLSADWTTRIDGVEDTGIVDIGYHYSSVAGPVSPSVMPVFPISGLVISVILGCFIFVLTLQNLH